jgi:Uncharacterized conserved protein
MFIMILWTTFLLYILLVRQPTTSDTLNRFAWGVSGGSITGLQNFLKDSLTIIKACGATGEAYPWYFYIFVLLAMLSSFTGLLFLTACMKRYDATFSSAMFVGSFVISASIMSAVHYDTFQNLESIWNWIMYLLGLMILMIGVKMLVNATDDTPHAQAEEEERQQQQEEEENMAYAIPGTVSGATATMTMTTTTRHDCNNSSGSSSSSSSSTSSNDQSYSMSFPLLTAGAALQHEEHDDPKEAPRGV